MSVLQYVFSPLVKCALVLGSSLILIPIASAKSSVEGPAASRTLSTTAPSAAVPIGPPVAAALGTKFTWRQGRAPQLLWTGFRPRHDGGQVLIQTSGEVELQTRPSSEGTVFVLKGCRAARRTDRLALETRYFDSAVTRVSLKQHAGDLEIAISLRQPVTAVSRKEAGPGGSWFWILEFPAASATATTTAATTTGAAKP